MTHATSAFPAAASAQGDPVFAHRPGWGPRARALLASGSEIGLTQALRAEAIVRIEPAPRSTPRAASEPSR